MGKFDREIDIIAASGFFDRAWYLAEHPDVKTVGLDPIEHYLLIGAALLRDPSPKFSTKEYLDRRPEVQASGANPLVHFLTNQAPSLACSRDVKAPVSPAMAQPSTASDVVQGQHRRLIEPDVAEALRDSRLFDARFYRQTHGIASDIDCIIDFLSHPSRQPSPYFDPGRYLSRYQDAAAAGISAFEHYVVSGRAKGYRPSPIFDGTRIDMDIEVMKEIIANANLFDEAWYKHRYCELLKGGDPLHHYVTFGASQGCAPNGMFIPQYYQAQDPEIAAFGWNPLVHYALVGTYHRIDPHPLFDTDWYCRVHKLQDPQVPILAHYLTVGRERCLSPHEYFDTKFYLKNYPEAASYPGGSVAHFMQKGHLSGNNPSPRFDVAAYLKANADVRAAGLNPLVHFVRHGRTEGRNPKPECRTIASSLVRFGDAEYGGSGQVLRYDDEIPLAQGFTLTIGVHLHLFYADLADEFCMRLAHIPAPFTLFISVTSSEVDVPELQARFAKGLPRCDSVVVRSVPNRGRDIAPFLVEFASELSQFDLVLHLHSKRSKHTAHADWRRFLLHYTLGNRSIVSQILNIFNENKTIGMVRPPYYGGLRSQPNWGKNRDKVIEVLETLNFGLAGERCPDFPAGSFFWARTDAIRPLFEAGYTVHNFPEEAGQIDGTLAHAIERVFGVLLLAQGSKMVCPYIDVAHNLVSYYGKGRSYPRVAIDRSRDIAAYQTAVAARNGLRGQIAFVTAVFAGSDTLMLPEQLEDEVDYFCVSDRALDGYGVFRIAEALYGDADPERSVGYIKTNLLRSFEGYDYVVWIDANVLFRGRVSQMIAELRASGCHIGAIAHPFRGNCYDEAGVCKEEKLDDPAVIAAQMDRYIGLVDKDDQLVETNFMILDARDPRVAEFQQLWSNEINTHSRCDRPRVNYALKSAGITWHPLLDERKSVRDADQFAIICGWAD